MMNPAMIRTVQTPRRLTLKCALALTLLLNIALGIAASSHAPGAEPAGRADDAAIHTSFGAIGAATQTASLLR